MILASYKSMRDRACKNQPCEYKKLPIFSYLHYHNLKTIYTNMIKSVTTAEFNGLSSKIYRNGIPHSELKILAKIQLSVICAHMVDFHRPGYITWLGYPLLSTGRSLLEVWTLDLASTSSFSITPLHVTSTCQ